MSAIDSVISALHGASSEMGNVQASLGNAVSEADNAIAQAAAFGSTTATQQAAAIKDAVETLRGHLASTASAIDDTLTQVQSIASST